MVYVLTADGKEVTEGASVFNFYDGKWGTVGAIDNEGWFDHSPDDGSQRSILNGERVCVSIPRGNPFYATHARCGDCKRPMNGKPYFNGKCVSCQTKAAGF